jgi:hypothetical protein
MENIRVTNYDGKTGKVEGYGERVVVKLDGFNYLVPDDVHLSLMVSDDRPIFFKVITVEGDSARAKIIEDVETLEVLAEKQKTKIINSVLKKRK